MSKIEFTRIEGSGLDTLPEQAIKYLDDASKYMRNSFPVARALDQARSNQGEIWLVRQNQDVLGAFFINFIGSVGLHVNLPLLGGQKIELWKDDLSQFLNQRCRDLGAIEFTMFGRPGWGKMFPELENMGCVLRKSF